MVIVHRPDLNRTMYCDDEIWYKTLKKFCQKIISNVNQNVAFHL